MVEEVSTKAPNENIYRYDTCDFCLNTKKNNKYGQYEELLVCKDCSAKAHPTCMKYSSELAKAASAYAWQCIECKTCSICNSAEDAASILFCDACDKAYHMECHIPHILEKPYGTWKCQNCILNTKRKKNILDINNPQNWSVYDVVDYFSSLGFSDSENAFKAAEIDGSAIMLLKREDVVSGLGLKLGPAVKIYDIIRRLQAQRNEHFLNNPHSAS